MGAGLDADDVDLGRLADLGLVLAADAGLELGDRVGFDQADGATAESRPHHPGPQDAGDAAGGVDEGVELGRGHLVVVAQPGVGQVHQPPEDREIVAGQGGAGLGDTDVLPDDVLAALEDDRVEIGATVAEQVQGDIAQGADGRIVDAQGLDPRFALSAADIVFGRGQLAPDPGVGDDDAEVLPLEGNGLVVERSAVDLQDGLGPAEDVDVLVHDAAADADELVLGLLGQLDQGQPVEPQAEHLVEGEGQAAFDGRRGGHARADRDVAAEDAADAPDTVAGLDELVEDALEVVGPAQGRAVELADLEAELLVEIARDEMAE